MDLVVGFGRLVGELVAGEIEYFEPFVAILRIEGLEIFVLRGEAAARGRVHDEQDLALVILQGDL